MTHDIQAINHDGEDMITQKRKEAGFTLTELMIALTIFGLIVILSIPNFNRFMQGWRLNGEIQQLASALRTARSSAVKKNIDVVFTFDPETNRYSYFEDNDRNGSLDTNEYQSGEHEMPAGITIAAHTLPSTTLTFGNKGNTRNSGSITLRNTNNDAKSVRIFGGTGNVTVD
jgi:type IV fimbrial biogenesis protein FimT